MENQDQTNKEPKKESKLPILTFSILAMLISITVFLDLRAVKEDVSKLTDYIESSNLVVSGSGAQLIQEIQDIINKYKK